MSFKGLTYAQKVLIARQVVKLHSLVDFAMTVRTNQNTLVKLFFYLIPIRQRTNSNTHVLFFWIKMVKIYGRYNNQNPI